MLIYVDINHCYRHKGYDGEDNGKRYDQISELEAQLKRAEEALNAADFDIWENNFATGEANNTNKKLFTALGYSKEELPESVEELIALVHPDDLIKYQKLMNAHFAGETDPYKALYRAKALGRNRIETYID